MVVSNTLKSSQTLSPLLLVQVSRRELPTKLRWRYATRHLSWNRLRDNKRCAMSVAELAHSSSNLIRLAAWKALQKVCLCSVTSRFLVAQESFQRAIVSNMTETSDGDISTAMQVLQQVVREQHNREAICQSRILDHLIEMVTSNESTD